MARILVSKCNKMKEMELTKDEGWEPKFVFSIKPMCEIVSVDSGLCNQFLNYQLLEFNLGTQMLLTLVILRSLLGKGQGQQNFAYIVLGYI